MPRRSTKENKNIYFQSREEAGLTRAQASEATYISESRIEKIEYGQMQINPQDVVAMARAYKKPSLCNYYCANDCEIGKESVPELKITNLSQIVLTLLSSINELNDEKDKLIRISADDKIMGGKRIDAFIADHGAADDSRIKLEKA